MYARRGVVTVFITIVTILWQVVVNISRREREMRGKYTHNAYNHSNKVGNITKA